MKNINELKNEMKAFAAENEMSHKELCENACFDFDPEFSEAITEVIWKRLGVDENSKYDFFCAEYSNEIEKVFEELVCAE